MNAMEHARRLRRISGRIKRHSDKLAEAQRDLCAALTDAANAACDQQLLTATETGEVVAPKDDDDGSGG